LIVDDISDYGGTFKMTSKALLKEFPQAFIGLYVTHYLGHGGIASFREAGIQRVYTSDSLTLYRQSKGLDEINQGLKVIDTEDLNDN
jgi:phosphoribosylpyrophosphate synthetase